MHICSGIARHLRNTRWPALDIYHDKEYAEFQTTIDAEMKRLQRNGHGSKRCQAEPLSEDDEEILWNKGLLGDHSPQSLLNTMVFMNGLYFALRSGREHREHRFDSCTQKTYRRIVQVVSKDVESAGSMLNTNLMWKIHRGVLFVFSNCIVALTNPRGIHST